jgi:hypothetical protein
MLQDQSGRREIAINVSHRVALGLETDDEYAVRGKMATHRDQRGDLGTGSDESDDIARAHDRVKDLRRFEIKSGEISPDVIGPGMIRAGRLEKHLINVDAHNPMPAVVQGSPNATLPTPRVKHPAAWGDQCINQSRLTLDVDTLCYQLTEMVGVRLRVAVVGVGEPPGC